MSHRNMDRADAAARVTIQLERLNDLLNARPNDEADIAPGLKYRRAEEHSQSAAQNKDMGRAIGAIEALLKEHEAHYGSNPETIIHVGEVADDIDNTLIRLEELSLEPDVAEYIADIRTQLEPVLEDYRLY